MYTYKYNCKYKNLISPVMSLQPFLTLSSLVGQPLRRRKNGYRKHKWVSAATAKTLGALNFIDKVWLIKSGKSSS